MGSSASSKMLHVQLLAQVVPPVPRQAPGPVVGAEPRALSVEGTRARARILARRSAAQRARAAQRRRALGLLDEPRDGVRRRSQLTIKDSEITKKAEPGAGIAARGKAKVQLAQQTRTRARAALRGSEAYVQQKRPCVEEREGGLYAQRLGCAVCMCRAEGPGRGARPPP